MSHLDSPLQILFSVRTTILLQKSMGVFALFSHFQRIFHQFRDGSCPICSKVFPIETSISSININPWLFSAAEKPEKDHRPCASSEHLRATDMGVTSGRVNLGWGIWRTSQWEFQDPKMEVLYHIRPYFVGIFPYIGLTQALHRPYIYIGTSNLGS